MSVAALVMYALTTVTDADVVRAVGGACLLAAALMLTAGAVIAPPVR